MPQLRFRGLVRAMNHVRASLAAGIAPEEAGAFRDYVNTAVRTVERGCKEARIRPEDLAPPSYRAYRFLKSVDLRRLPIRTADSAPAAAPVRVANVVAVCSTVQRAILDLVPDHGPPPRPDDPHVEGLRMKLARHVAEIEALCREQGGRPEDLPTRSRQGYLWLRLLSRPGCLPTHLATVARVLQAGQDQLARHPRLAARGLRRLSVQMTYSNTLVSGKQVGHAIQIRLHQGYMGAPNEVIEAVAPAALGDPEALACLRRYALDSQFRANIAEIERVPEDRQRGGDGADGPGVATQSASGEPHAAAGRHHKLAASFDRVNRAYFEGRMSRPKLAWNSTITHRKLGHYNLHTDEVMLSVTLDDPRVPAYVVDFVMYHELLHKQLGVRAVNGRQRAHTPEFRRAERRFKDYRKAEAFLRRLGERVDL